MPKAITEITNVIFRRWKDEDKSVFALFPQVPATRDPYACLSYAHMGQHGSADPTGCINRSRPVDINEPDVKALKNELEQRGYILKVKQRLTAKDLNLRRLELSLSRP